MPKGGKVSSSVLPSALRQPLVRAMCVVLCLLVVLFHVGVLTGGGAGVDPPPTPTDAVASTEPRRLEAGDAVSEVVSSREVHTYALDLLEGQYARIEIAKGDLILKVAVCAPAGRSCLELFGRRYGRLDLSFTADVSATYRLEIRSLETDAVGRSYELRVAEVVTATQRHRLADDAVRAAAEAEDLRERSGASSHLAAVSKYGEAQRLWESAGEFTRAAEALSDMGDLYFALSQFKQSQAHYLKSLSLSERSGDRLSQLAALNGISYANVYLGENQKALLYARKALDVIEHVESGVRASAAYRRAEAQALNNFGEIYYSFGELRKSIEMFERAHDLWAAAGERRGEALAVLNLGYSHSDLGDLRTASENFQRSLALWQSVGDRRGTALSQTALGGVHTYHGNSQLALELHHRAVEQFRTIGNQQGEAAALNGVAQVYEDMNEYRAAFDNYHEALRLYEAIGNRDFAALNKFYVGKILYRMGEVKRALDYYRGSLSLSREVGDRLIEAHALKGLATIYSARGDKSRALVQFGAALSLYRQLGNRRSQAHVLNDIGHNHLSSGDAASALARYRQALPLMRETGDRRGEAQTLFNTARAESARGNLSEALTLIEESIAISEFLRMKIRNSDLRMSYFALVHQYYELYIDLLMRMHALRPDRGFAAAALVVSERARARALLESLLEGKIKPRRGASSDLLVREEELLQALDEKADYQMRLLAGKHTEEEAEQVSRELRVLTSEYQDVRARLREQSPRHATLTQPGQLPAEDLQRLVKDDSLLLEFALGDERSYLWVVSTDEIKSYELPGRSTIEELARRVYELLTARQSLIEKSSPADEELAREADAEYWQQSAMLSQMLLGPAADLLGSKRLLIVSDGFLRYIPFEALPVPASSPAAGQPATTMAPGAELELLFFNHEIVGLPSALTLLALRREENRTNSATKTIAVLADPVFDKDDPRILARQDSHGASEKVMDADIYLSSALRDFTSDGGTPSLSRLPSTLREAKAIMAVTPPSDGLIATGFAANRERVVNDDLRDYRVIHFATHGLLNSEHSELSGIILSLVDERGNKLNGFLRLHDIYNLDLSADLVVLSACRTGLGKNVQGEGVVSLTNGFLYAGAKSVISSLWKVDDEATAELMSHFYAAMLKEGLPPAAALRAAKREMWKQENRHAPFYWAAFVLQGEYSKDIRVARRQHLPEILIIGGILIILGTGLYLLRARSRRSV